MPEGREVFPLLSVRDNLMMGAYTRSDTDGVLGVIGVIGPTRMAYERVIPIVDMTARLLGSALNSRR